MRDLTKIVFRLFSILAVASLFSTALFSQDYDAFKSEIPAVEMPVTEELQFANMETKALVLKCPVILDGAKRDILYVSKSGWLATDEKASLNIFRENSESAVFIAPFLIMNEKDAFEGFEVLYETGIVEKQTVQLITWQNSMVSYTVIFYENGDIQFNNQNDINFLKEISSDYPIVFSGVITNNLAYGYSNRKITTFKYAKQLLEDDINSVLFKYIQNPFAQNYNLTLRRQKSL